MIRLLALSLVGLSCPVLAAHSAPANSLSTGTYGDVAPGWGGSFPEDLREDFSKLKFGVHAPTISILAGAGEITAEGVDGLLVTDMQMGPSSNPCALYPISDKLLTNIDLGGDLDAGSLTLRFSQPVHSFYVYLTSFDAEDQGSSGPSLIWIYDDQDVLLWAQSIDLGNDCDFDFFAWQDSKGAQISRVELTSGTPNRRIAIGLMGVDYGVPIYTDLGNALAGGEGFPSMIFQGNPYEFQTVKFDVLSDDGWYAYLVLNTSAAYLPFAGGVMVPDPLNQPVVFEVPLLPITADHSVEFTWPSTALAGQTVYAQWWVVDPFAPQGLSASKAIAITEF